MEHFGTFDERGVDHFMFLTKAEEILKYIHEIGKHFTWEERRVLEQAAEIIAKRLEERKTCQEEHIKKIMS